MMIDVLVYKTSVSNNGSVKILKPFLDDLLADSKWNFDLEDCDNILRVESEHNVSKKYVKF